MKKLLATLTLLFSINHALASELTDVAACAGMIIGDAVITYELDRNADNFEVALEVAYAGYFGYVFGVQAAQQDVLQADTVMQNNIEIIYNKY
jgi:glutamine amidotransferase PdxT